MAHGSLCLAKFKMSNIWTPKRRACTIARSLTLAQLFGACLWLLQTKILISSNDSEIGRNWWIMSMAKLDAFASQKESYFATGLVDSDRTVLMCKRGTSFPRIAWP